MLLCPNGLVSNVTVSNRFGVQSVPCPILLFLNDLASDPNVFTRFSVQSYCVHSFPFPRLLHYVSNPHMSNGFDHPIKLFVCPIFLCPIGSVSNVAVSNRTCESNAVGMCPIKMC